MTRPLPSVILNLSSGSMTGSTTEVGGYEIFLKDYKKIDEVADEIYEMDNFPLPGTPKVPEVFRPIFLTG